MTINSNNVHHETKQKKLRSDGSYNAELISDKDYFQKRLNCEKKIIDKHAKAVNSILYGGKNNFKLWMWQEELYSPIMVRDLVYTTIPYWPASITTRSLVYHSTHYYLFAHVYSSLLLLISCHTSTFLCSFYLLLPSFPHLSLLLPHSCHWQMWGCQLMPHLQFMLTKLLSNEDDLRKTALLYLHRHKSNSLWDILYIIWLHF